VTFLELHPLTTQQLDAAVELDQLCFGGLWTRSGYERELDSPNSQLLVLKPADGEKEPGFGGQSAEVLDRNSVITDANTVPAPQNPLLGLGCYWSILEEAHITILAVHPDYQRQSLGQLILHTLLRDARQRQLEWATLEVKPSNQAALSLYQKFGFAIAGRRRNYYKDTGEDALILWRGGLQTLEFEEFLADLDQQLRHKLACLGWQLSEDWEATRVTDSSK
jgi:ribosomal-protein-alanine N-acetyltransferase